MMILTIDGATTTGWACGESGQKVPDFGTVTFGGTGRTNGEVISRARAWFLETCYRRKPDRIVFESPYVPRPRPPRFPGDKAGGMPMNPLVLRRLYGIVGVVESVAHEIGVQCFEVDTGSAIKYFLAGKVPKKREEKKAATIKMCRLIGWNVADDNQADACAIWSMAEMKFDPRAASRRGTEPLWLQAANSAA